MDPEASVVQGQAYNIVSSRPTWESQTKTWTAQQLCFIGILFVVISRSCAWRVDGNVCDMSCVPWLGCIWIVFLRALCCLHPWPAAILNAASLKNKYTVKNVKPESVRLPLGPSTFTYQQLPNRIILNTLLLILWHQNLICKMTIILFYQPREIVVKTEPFDHCSGLHHHPLLCRPQPFLCAQYPVVCRTCLQSNQQVSR